MARDQVSQLFYIIFHSSSDAVVQRCDICSSVKTLISYWVFNGFQIIPHSSTQAHRRHGGHRPNQCLAESLFFHRFLMGFKEMLPILGHPFGPPSRKHKVFQRVFEGFPVGHWKAAKSLQDYIKTKL